MTASTTYAQNKRPFPDISENTSENHTCNRALALAQICAQTAREIHMEHTSEEILLFGEELTFLWTL